jgi:hypothetical protein
VLLSGITNRVLARTFLLTADQGVAQDAVVRFVTPRSATYFGEPAQLQLCALLSSHLNASALFDSVRLHVAAPGAFVPTLPATLGLQTSTALPTQIASTAGPTALLTTADGPQTRSSAATGQVTTQAATTLPSIVSDPSTPAEGPTTVAASTMPPVPTPTTTSTTTTTTNPTTPTTTTPSLVRRRRRRISLNVGSECDHLPEAGNNIITLGANATTCRRQAIYILVSIPPP